MSNKEENSKESENPSKPKVPSEILTVEHMVKTAKNMAHFTAKLVNTNIQHNSAVRVGPEDRLCLPYVGVRTLGAENVPMEVVDDVVRSLTSANVLEQVLAAAPHGKSTFFREEEILNAAHTKEIADAAQEVFSKSAEINTEVLSRYLRQIFLPHPEMPDGYVCVTPLSSSGVSGLMADALQAQRQNAEKGQLRSLIFAQLPFGGGIPRNVGRLVDRSRKAPFFEGPKVDPILRQALSQYYRGVPVPVDRARLAQFVSFWLQVFTAPGASRNARVRNHFIQFWEATARAYTEDLLLARRNVMQLAQKYGLDLTEEISLRGAQSASLSAAIAGVSDDPDRAQAHRFVTTVAREKVRVGGEWVRLSSLGFTEQHEDFRRAVTLVRRILRSI